MYPVLSSFLIVFVLFYEKYHCIKWLRGICHRFDNYEITKDYFYLQRFINYTTVASYLAILSSLYTIATGQLPPPDIMVMVWNQTFTITMGYWIMVYPDTWSNNDPRNYYLDTLQHGPVLILYTYQISYYHNPFTMLGLIYSFIYGYFYLFFIWIPYYYLTGDPIYKVMNGGIVKKIGIISIINLICLCGQIIGLYLFS
tara:strand:- start:3442 stop:4038 length:597 start_codon:yes stop_codon:yes gene_type:complete